MANPNVAVGLGVVKGEVVEVEVDQGGSLVVGQAKGVVALD